MRHDETTLDTREAKRNETVADSNSGDLRTTLQDILAQLANLSARLADVEKQIATPNAEHPPAASLNPAMPQAPDTSSATSSMAVAAGISEQELLAISAALAAWLGVQAHIRQIRLIRTGAWAQQGRVTIQASHLLNY